MKNFTLALVIIALGFGFINQAHAQRQISVTEMISPAAGSNITPGVPTKYKFVIKNTGTETIEASDTIIVGWGPSNGTQVALQTPVNMFSNPHKVLAPNDTVHFTYSLNLSGVTGTFYLGFLASYTVKLSAFKGIIVAYNMTVGIDEQAKAINNVWFSNNTLNYELIPKATCKANLNILNMNGQIVKDQQLSFTAGNSINETISMGTLPQGVYILSIQTPYGVDTKKFVVQ
jgi:hypothetical protein